MEARNQERERIARELHDTILQETQGLVLSFQALAGQLQTDNKVRLSIESLLDNAEQAIESARKSVSNLRDSDTNPANLVERFEALMDDLSDAAIPVSLSVHGIEQTLKNDLAEHIYRIGREAVLNALRHSRANRVDVALKFEGQCLRMIVSDDGVGMGDLARAPAGRPGHWGLVGMRERAATIDAQLLIQSAAGSGTTVELRTKRRHEPLRDFSAVLRNAGCRRHRL
jgi:signal transduction histidine kinase